jgi:acetolactate synthase small subunit
MAIATLNNSNSITQWVTRTNDLINVVNVLDADQAITTQRIADAAVQSSKLATDINIRGTLRIQDEDIRDYITAYHIGFGG